MSVKDGSQVSKMIRHCLTSMVLILELAPQAAKQIENRQNRVKLIRIDETGKEYNQSPYKES